MYSESSSGSLKDKLIELGIRITSMGPDTLVGRIDEEQFEEVFGGQIEHVPGKPPGTYDKGSPPGYRMHESIKVPDTISSWIESIYIEPPFTRFK